MHMYSVHACAYLCTVYMHVRTYSVCTVYMHVRTYVQCTCMCVRMYSVHACVYLCTMYMHVRTYVQCTCMYVPMYVCDYLYIIMYVCITNVLTYVCMCLDSSISEVLDTSTVSCDSLLEVRVSSVHCIPGTTTSEYIRTCTYV